MYRVTRHGGQYGILGNGFIGISLFPSQTEAALLAQVLNRFDVTTEGTYKILNAYFSVHRR